MSTFQAQTSASTSSMCAIVRPILHHGALVSPTVGLLWLQSVGKLRRRETCISIQVQSPDDGHALGCGGYVIVLPQERLQIFLIDVAILPIVDGVKSFPYAKALGCIHLLFELLSDSVQGYLSVCRQR